MNLYILHTMAFKKNMISTSRHLAWFVISLVTNQGSHPWQCYIPGHKRARWEGQNWRHLRQHWSLHQTSPIERFDVVNYEGQTLCTWTWWDPQQSVKTSPCGYTENPKRYPKQDMELSSLTSSMGSSNSDPNPPKPNKDHTDPHSYGPISLTSCQCKVLEGMINCFIWYLEKSRILDKSQCGFRKCISGRICQRQQALGLLFDLEKVCETAWQYGITQNLHRICLRGRLPIFCVRMSQGPANPSQNRDNTLWWILPRGRCSNWWCPGCDIFGLNVDELPSCVARDIFRALFVDDLVICFVGTPWRHHRETCTAGSKCHTGIGDKEWFQVCCPQMQSCIFHCTPILGSEPTTVRIGNTSASGRVNKVPWTVVGLAPLIQEAHQCAKDTVQGGSQPHLNGCSFEVGRRQTHFWCCTRPLFTASWTTVALCMAQCQTLTYNNWTASITLDWDCIGSILHQPSVQPIHRGQWSSFWGVSVKAVHALLSENSCLHQQSSTSCPAWIWPNNHLINMLPDQMGGEAWPGCAQAKFNAYHEQRSHDEIYTDGSKMNESGGSSSQQLSSVTACGSIVAYLFTLTKYKHHKRHKPILHLESQTKEKFCLVKSLTEFLAVHTKTQDHYSSWNQQSQSLDHSSGHSWKHVWLK